VTTPVVSNPATRVIDECIDPGRATSCSGTMMASSR
jgi:hypothetical protein